MTSALCNDGYSPAITHHPHGLPLKKMIFAGLAIGTAIAAVLFMVLNTGEPSRTPAATLNPLGRSVNGLLFDPSGKFLVVASTSVTVTKSPEFYEGRLSIWDVDAKKQLASFVTPFWISSMAMSQKGDLLVVVLGGPKEDTGWINDGKPREIRTYSFPEMKELVKRPWERYINSAVISPDGKWLAAASMSDTDRGPADVTVFDVVTLKPKYTIKDHSHSKTQVRFSPDGKTLAFGEYYHAEKGEKGGIPAKILQVECESGKPGKELSLNRDDKPSDFDYTPDGKNMVVDCGRVSRWNLASGEESKFFDHLLSRVEKRRIALSSDGKWLVVGTEQVLGRPKIPATVVIWDIENRKAKFEWQAKTPRVCFALTADKKKLAVGSDQVYLFDLQSGK